MLTKTGPVVSNTTPIISLAGVGLLDLLQRVFGEVWIPEAVQDEYNEGREAHEPVLSDLPWIRILPVHFVEPNALMLDGGEAAAISLAKQFNAREVILDELRARRVATEMGMSVIGTIGVLVVAQRQRLIPELRPILDLMRNQGRRISESLYQQALSLAGE